MKGVYKTLKSWIAGGGLAVTLFMAGAETAYAVGTDANQSLASTATINYDVGLTAQSALNQASGAFVVDRKINMTMTTSATSLTPGAADQVTTFTLTNTGNATQGYRLQYWLTGTTAILDTSAIKIYIDGGNAANNSTSAAAGGDDVLYGAGYTGTSGTGSLKNIQDVAEDAVVKIYVINTASAHNGTTVVNGATATLELAATALVGGAVAQNVNGTVITSDSGSANTAGTVETVFSDGSDGTANDAATDGIIGATSLLTVGAADLTITKTISVINETGASCQTAVAVANAKAIPGACMDITITVANGAGAASADNLIITDPLDTDMTMVGVHTASDCGGSVHTTGYSYAAPTVTCNLKTGLGVALAAGASATLKYRATVN